MKKKIGKLNDIEIYLASTPRSDSESLYSYASVPPGANGYQKLFSVSRVRGIRLLSKDAYPQSPVGYNTEKNNCNFPSFCPSVFSGTKVCRTRFDMLSLASHDNIFSE